jgi:hypothetical protein
MRDVGLARPVEKAKGAMAGNVAGLMGKASLNHKGPACLIRFLLVSPPRLQAGRDDIRPLPAHSLHGAG